MNLNIIRTPEIEKEIPEKAQEIVTQILVVFNFLSCIDIYLLQSTINKLQVRVDSQFYMEQLLKQLENSLHTTGIEPVSFDCEQQAYATHKTVNLWEVFIVQLQGTSRPITQW